MSTPERPAPRTATAARYLLAVTAMPVAAAALAIAALAATPAAAAAQDLSGGIYAFFDRQLAIEVEPVAPGTLHVIRGRAGRLEVNGRSVGGFAAYGLTGHTRDRLQLTPVGAERVEYMVVVPEHVRVRLHLPDGIVDVPAREPATTWQWVEVAPADRREPGLYDTGPGLSPAARPYAPGRVAPIGPAAPNGRVAPNGPAAPNGRAAPNGPAAPNGRAAPNARPTLDSPASAGGLPVAYRSTPAAAPHTLTISDAGALGRLEVRIGGDEFTVATSRVLALRSVVGGELELPIGGVGADVIVEVPAGGDFRLVADGGVLLDVRSGRGSTRCEPVTIQRLASGERYTFTPIHGLLNCR